jgi:hypothetical protein
MTAEASEKRERRLRGPRPDVKNDQKVASLIRRYGEDWILDDNLTDICEALDNQHVPIPKT